ncbi:MAG: S8 family peptidase [Chitinophagaceae bacterium]|jgi:cell wall-associated protease|nr:S8 family peptidase [Chitinophagaceae bacterium]
MKNISVSLCLLFSFISTAMSQEYYKGWHHGDLDSNGVYGTSTERAYKELLKINPPKKRIIVAVIDSGIDTAHEDLKPVLWVNKKEIPNNGIDDDKNGYKDDVHGWNFIGGRDGRNVGKDSYEGARLYYRLKKVFGTDTVNEKSLDEEKATQYKLYKKVAAQLENQAKEASMYVMILKDIVAKIPAADSLLRTAMSTTSYTGDELQNFKSNDAQVSKAKSTMLGLFQQTRQMESSNVLLIGELMQFYEGEKSKIDALEKEPPHYRDDIVKDNYGDLNDRFYGNNDVMGTDASHGTHVAGIIGAIRGNDKGIDGIANHVQIMPIRAVPDGDEHDKDIANAIRYAVDNGALIINMSFGKSFSPEKKWVDEAVQYAESKGVLLVHAAGNDAKNIDADDNFPSRNFNNDTLKVFSNWITVGASGATANEIAAPFSNFGKREVNLFAPGVKIYSTIPGGNAYGEKDGTSMAAPVVSGIAALLLSYHPDISAKQLIEILEQSSKKINITFPKPGAQEKIMLSDLSITGAIVNTYDALKLASKVKGERKIANPPPVKKKKN